MRGLLDLPETEQSRFDDGAQPISGHERLALVTRFDEIESQLEEYDKRPRDLAGLLVPGEDVGKAIEVGMKDLVEMFDINPKATDTKLERARKAASLPFFTIAMVPTFFGSLALGQWMELGSNGVLVGRTARQLTTGGPPEWHLKPEQVQQLREEQMKIQRQLK